MIKDVWDSFKDNIKERVSNPFLGTFALVWVVHNWQIVYAFFYFDSDWKLKNKIEYFSKYWTDNSFIWNLVCVAFITVGVLVITYLFLAVSRFFANYFENVIIPQISKLSKGKIVTEETYQIAVEKIQSLEAKVEVERKAKNEAIQERDEFEKEKYQSIKVDSDQVTVTIIYDKQIEEANKQFTKDKVENTLLSILKSYSFDDTDMIINFLLKNGFIKPKELDGMGNWRYSFTKEGEEFKTQFFRTTL